MPVISMEEYGALTKGIERRDAEITILKDEVSRLRHDLMLAISSPANEAFNARLREASMGRRHDD